MPDMSDKLLADAKRLGVVKDASELDALIRAGERWLSRPGFQTLDVGGVALALNLPANERERHAVLGALDQRVTEATPL